MSALRVTIDPQSADAQTLLRIRAAIEEMFREREGDFAVTVTVERPQRTCSRHVERILAPWSTTDEPSCGGPPPALLRSSSAFRFTSVAVFARTSRGIDSL